MENPLKRYKYSSDETPVWKEFNWYHEGDKTLTTEKSVKSIVGAAVPTNSEFLQIDKGEKLEDIRPTNLGRPISGTTEEQEIWKQFNWPQSEEEIGSLPKDNGLDESFEELLKTTSKSLSEQNNWQNSDQSGEEFIILPELTNEPVNETVQKGILRTITYDYPFSTQSIISSTSEFPMNGNVISNNRLTLAKGQTRNKSIEFNEKKTNNYTLSHPRTQNKTSNAGMPVPVSAAEPDNIFITTEVFKYFPKVDEDNKNRNESTKTSNESSKILTEKTSNEGDTTQSVSSSSLITEKNKIGISQPYKQQTTKSTIINRKPVSANEFIELFLTTKIFKLLDLSGKNKNWGENNGTPIVTEISDRVSLKSDMLQETSSAERGVTSLETYKEPVTSQVESTTRAESEGSPKTFGKELNTNLENEVTLSKEIYQDTTSNQSELNPTYTMESIHDNINGKKEKPLTEENRLTPSEENSIATTEAVQHSEEIGREEIKKTDSSQFEVLDTVTTSQETETIDETNESTLSGVQSHFTSIPKKTTTSFTLANELRTSSGNELSITKGAQDSSKTESEEIEPTITSEFAISDTIISGETEQIQKSDSVTYEGLTSTTHGEQVKTSTSINRLTAQLQNERTSTEETERSMGINTKESGQLLSSDFVTSAQTSQETTGESAQSPISDVKTDFVYVTDETTLFSTLTNESKISSGNEPTLTTQGSSEIESRQTETTNAYEFEISATITGGKIEGTKISGLIITNEDLTSIAQDENMELSTSGNRIEAKVQTEITSTEETKSSLEVTSKGNRLILTSEFAVSAEIITSEEPEATEEVAQSPISGVETDFVSITEETDISSTSTNESKISSGKESTQGSLEIETGETEITNNSALEISATVRGENTQETAKSGTTTYEDLTSIPRDEHLGLSTSANRLATKLQTEITSTEETVSIETYNEESEQLFTSEFTMSAKIITSEEDESTEDSTQSAISAFRDHHSTTSNKTALSLTSVDDITGSSGDDINLTQVIQSIEDTENTEIGREEHEQSDTSRFEISTLTDSELEISSTKPSGEGGTQISKTEMHKGLPTTIRRTTENEIKATIAPEPTIATATESSVETTTEDNKGILTSAFSNSVTTLISVVYSSSKSRKEETEETPTYPNELEISKTSASAEIKEHGKPIELYTTSETDSQTREEYKETTEEDWQDSITANIELQSEQAPESTISVIMGQESTMLDENKKLPSTLRNELNTNLERVTVTEETRTSIEKETEQTAEYGEQSGKILQYSTVTHTDQRPSTIYEEFNKESSTSNNKLRTNSENEAITSEETQTSNKEWQNVELASTSEKANEETEQQTFKSEEPVNGTSSTSEEVSGTDVKIGPTSTSYDFEIVSTVGSEETEDTPNSSIESSTSAYHKANETSSLVTAEIPSFELTPISESTQNEERKQSYRSKNQSFGSTVGGDTEEPNKSTKDLLNLDIESLTRGDKGETSTEEWQNSELVEGENTVTTEVEGFYSSDEIQKTPKFTTSSPDLFSTLAIESKILHENEITSSNELKNFEVISTDGGYKEETEQSTSNVSGAYSPTEEVSETNDVKETAIPTGAKTSIGQEIEVKSISSVIHEDQGSTLHEVYAEIEPTINNEISTLTIIGETPIFESARTEKSEDLKVTNAFEVHHESKEAHISSSTNTKETEQESAKSENTASNSSESSTEIERSTAFKYEGGYANTYEGKEVRTQINSEGIFSDILVSGDTSEEKAGLSISSTTETKEIGMQTSPLSEELENGEPDLTSIFENKYSTKPTNGGTFFGTNIKSESQETIPSFTTEDAIEVGSSSSKTSLKNENQEERIHEQLIAHTRSSKHYTRHISTSTPINQGRLLNTEPYFLVSNYISESSIKTSTSSSSNSEKSTGEEAAIPKNGANKAHSKDLQTERYNNVTSNSSSKSKYNESYNYEHSTSMIDTNTNTSAILNLNYTNSREASANGPLNIFSSTTGEYYKYNKQNENDEDYIENTSKSKVKNKGKVTMKDIQELSTSEPGNRNKIPQGITEPHHEDNFYLHNIWQEHSEKLHGHTSTNLVTPALTKLKPKFKNSTGFANPFERNNPGNKSYNAHTTSMIDNIPEHTTKSLHPITNFLGSRETVDEGEEYEKSGTKSEKPKLENEIGEAATTGAFLITYTDNQKEHHVLEVIVSPKATESVQSEEIKTSFDQKTTPEDHEKLESITEKTMHERVTEHTLIRSEKPAPSTRPITPSNRKENATTELRDEDDEVVSTTPIHETQIAAKFFESTIAKGSITSAITSNEASFEAANSYSTTSMTQNQNTQFTTEHQQARKSESVKVVISTEHLTRRLLDIHEVFNEKDMAEFPSNTDSTLECQSCPDKHGNHVLHHENFDENEEVFSKSTPQHYKGELADKEVLTKFFSNYLETTSHYPSRHENSEKFKDVTVKTEKHPEMESEVQHVIVVGDKEFEKNHHKIHNSVQPQPCTEGEKLADLELSIQKEIGRLKNLEHELEDQIEEERKSANYGNHHSRPSTEKHHEQITLQENQKYTAHQKPHPTEEAHNKEHEDVNPTEEAHEEQHEKPPTEKAQGGYEENHSNQDSHEEDHGKHHPTEKSHNEDIVAHNSNEGVQKEYGKHLHTEEDHNEGQEQYHSTEEAYEEQHEKFSTQKAHGEEYEEHHSNEKDHEEEHQSHHSTGESHDENEEDQYPTEHAYDEAREKYTHAENEDDEEQEKEHYTATNEKEHDMHVTEGDQHDQQKSFHTGEVHHGANEEHPSTEETPVEGHEEHVTVEAHVEEHEYHQNSETAKHEEVKEQNPTEEAHEEHNELSTEEAHGKGHEVLHFNESGHEKEHKKDHATEESHDEELEEYHPTEEVHNKAQEEYRPTADANVEQHDKLSTAEAHEGWHGSHHPNEDSHVEKPENHYSTEESPKEEHQKGQKHDFNEESDNEHLENHHPIQHAHEKAHEKHTHTENKDDEEQQNEHYTAAHEDEHGTYVTESIHHNQQESFHTGEAHHAATEEHPPTKGAHVEGHEEHVTEEAHGQEQEEYRPTADANVEQHDKLSTTEAHEGGHESHYPNEDTHVENPENHHSTEESPKKEHQKEGQKHDFTEESHNKHLEDHPIQHAHEKAHEKHTHTENKDDEEQQNEHYTAAHEDEHGTYVTESIHHNQQESFHTGEAHHAATEEHPYTEGSHEEGHEEHVTGETRGQEHKEDHPNMNVPEEEHQIYHSTGEYHNEVKDDYPFTVHAHQETHHKNTHPEHQDEDQGTQDHRSANEKEHDSHVIESIQHDQHGSSHTGEEQHAEEHPPTTEAHEKGIEKHMTEESSKEQHDNQLHTETAQLKWLKEHHPHDKEYQTHHPEDTHEQEHEEHRTEQSHEEDHKYYHHAEEIQNEEQKQHDSAEESHEKKYGKHHPTEESHDKLDEKNPVEESNENDQEDHHNKEHHPIEVFHHTEEYYEKEYLDHSKAKSHEEENKYYHQTIEPQNYEQEDHHSNQKSHKEDYENTHIPEEDHKKYHENHYQTEEAHEQEQEPHPTEESHEEEHEKDITEESHMKTHGKHPTEETHYATNEYHSTESANEKQHESHVTEKSHKAENEDYRTTVESQNDEQHNPSESSQAEEHVNHHITEEDHDKEYSKEKSHREQYKDYHIEESQNEDQEHHHHTEHTEKAHEKEYEDHHPTGDAQNENQLEHGTEESPNEEHGNYHHTEEARKQEQENHLTEEVHVKKHGKHHTEEARYTTNLDHHPTQNSHEEGHQIHVTENSHEGEHEQTFYPNEQSDEKEQEYHLTEGSYTKSREEEHNPIEKAHDQKQEKQYPEEGANEKEYEKYHPSHSSGNPILDHRPTEESNEEDHEEHRGTEENAEDLHANLETEEIQHVTETKEQYATESLVSHEGHQVIESNHGVESSQHYFITITAGSNNEQELIEVTISPPKHTTVTNHKTTSSESSTLHIINDYKNKHAPIYIELPVVSSNPTHSLEEFINYYRRLFSENAPSQTVSRSGKDFVIVLSGIDFDDFVKMNGSKWIPANGAHLTPKEQNKSSEIQSKIKQTSCSCSENQTTEKSFDVNLSQETVLIPMPKNVVRTKCLAGDYCLCSIDDMVNNLKIHLRNKEYKLLSIEQCNTYLKVEEGLVINNDSLAEVRKKRSHFFLKLMEKNKEIIGLYKINAFFQEDDNLQNTDRKLYALSGNKVTIPCVYSSVIEESSKMKYSWSLEDNKPLTVGKIRDNDGSLTLHDITPQDDSNYTCFVKTHADDPQERAKFLHELSVVSLPVYKLKNTIYYDVDDGCTMENCDLLYNYMPKMIDGLLCGYYSKICRLEVYRPTCFKTKKVNHVNLTYMAILNPLEALVPVDTIECNIKCQLRIYSSLSKLILFNMEAVEKIPVISTLRSSKKHFKPQTLDLPNDSTSDHHEKDHNHDHYDDHNHEKSHNSSILGEVIFPQDNDARLLIACPGGFGLKSSHRKICFACPVNTYSSDDQSYCNPCPNGQYQNLRGSKTCIVCNSPLEDKRCLQVLYSNTKYFALYVGIAFTMVIFVLLAIYFFTKMDNAEFVYRPYPNEAPLAYNRRMAKMNKDVEADRVPLLADYNNSPPSVPPLDF